jgi:threonine aldolase
LIDLRSDTVSLPTPAMREAMALAELGDDVYGEDPTVNRLQEMAAALTGKEAALFVPTGTMGNLIAMLVHCPRGSKAIVGSKAHTRLYEAGGASALGAIVLTPVRNTDDGELDMQELADEVNTPADHHFAPPAMVSIESTHNMCGGVPVAVSHMARVEELSRSCGLATHLDGARIFNAALALETGVDDLASHVDSVSFCLSKGLACPVGSLLCGSREFIDQAHRTRKMLGGGMRQAGVIAAAGIVALESMIERLAEDHQHARVLAQGLTLIAGINVQMVSRRTNMVFFELEGDARSSQRFVSELKERGVLIGARGPSQFRAVTHHGVSRTDIDRTVSAASEAVAQALGD